MTRTPRHTFYEVYITRDQEISPGEPLSAITREEWLAIVSADSDIVMSSTGISANGTESLTEAWRLASNKNGTPIFYESGRIFIREDDSTTIEKMISIASLLNANVIGEDGSYFSEAIGLPAARIPSPTTAKRRLQTRGSSLVPLHDETIRKRQCILFMIPCLILPVFLAWKVFLGENPGELAFWGLCSLALFVYVGTRLVKPVYFIERIDDESFSVALLETKSTRTQVSMRTLKSSEIDPIELVCLPLGYPSRRTVEYHVRCQQHPMLVLYESRNKKKSRATLKRLSQKLLVTAIDHSENDAANNNVPKYRLTEREIEGKR